MNPAWWREASTRAGIEIVLTLHVQPGASDTAVVGAHGDALKVRLAAAPAEGKANAALLRYMADAFGVAVRQVQVVQGAASRRKVLVIQAPARRPAWLVTDSSPR